MTKEIEILTSSSKPRMRVINLYKLFKDHLNRKFSLGELAVNIGCSKSRILDMIGTIKAQFDGEYGFKLICIREDDGKNYYQVKTTREQIKITMDSESIQHLCLIRDMVRNLLPENMRQAATKSIKAVKTLVPPERLKEITFETFAEVKGSGQIDYDPFQHRIGILQKAIKEKKICEIKYQEDSKKWSGKRKNFIVAPLRFMLYRESLFLRCRVYVRNKISTNKLNLAIQRIDKIKITDEVFNLEEKKEEHSYYGMDFHEPIKVRLALAPQVATYFEDRSWSSFEKKRKKDGRLLLTFYTTNLVEVRYLVLSFLRYVEVLEPVKLRTDIKSIVKGFLRRN
ncbi:helix-turn-helix transcriptional regulator [Candidatus Riflebacteria bacterium]